MINVSCAIIIDNAGRILAAQRSAVMPLPHKWEFPGGKVEPAETPEQSVVREIKEELDINIEIISGLSPSIYVNGERTICLIPFICRIIEGEITLKEHQAYRWLSADELLALDWAEADVPIVNALLKA